MTHCAITCIMCHKIIADNPLICCQWSGMCNVATTQTLTKALFLFANRQLKHPSGGQHLPTRIAGNKGPVCASTNLHLQGRIHFILSSSLLQHHSIPFSINNADTRDAYFSRAPHPHSHRLVRSRKKFTPLLTQQ